MTKEDHNDHDKGKLPITILAGFLGAGKTTLLKHILETKHENGDFKFAVIVNDMAELNIDKSLIDTSAITQSDKVIAMENGCVCCSLAEDLKKQIINMATTKSYNYMIIEASGVSEPAAIAQLFQPCEEDHNHDVEHGTKMDDDSHIQIGDVARLDTCVTVVAADQFFSNIETVVKGPDDESWPRLMMDQIECANVILLNKTDLVSESQLAEVSEQVTLLNATAKIITARNSVINISKVIGTHMFDVDEGFDHDLKYISKFLEPDEAPDCCKVSIARGETACCNNSRTFDSAFSQVLLSSEASRKTRHSSRFGITSFIYTARRPFHPTRYYEKFAEKYFNIDIEKEDSDDEDDGDEEKDCDMDEIEETQEIGKEKQDMRNRFMGNLLRTKGFIWMPHAHDFKGILGQAGNTMQMRYEEMWNVLDSRAYHQGGNDEEKSIKKELRKDWCNPWGDRRQELVFIGQNLKHEVIQSLLDSCLLTDEEFSTGVDEWKATIGDILLQLNPDE